MFIQDDSPSARQETSAVSVELESPDGSSVTHFAESWAGFMASCFNMPCPKADSKLHKLLAVMVRIVFGLTDSHCPMSNEHLVELLSSKKAANQSLGEVILSLLKTVCVFIVKSFPTSCAIEYTAR